MAVRPDSVTIYMNSIELLLIVNAKFRALPIERLSSRPLIERLTVVESYGESRTWFAVYLPSVELMNSQIFMNNEK